MKKSSRPLLTVPCIEPLIFVPLRFRSGAKSQVVFLARPSFREPLAEVYCPTACVIFVLSAWLFARSAATSCICYCKNSGDLISRLLPFFAAEFSLGASRPWRTLCSLFLYRSRSSCIDLRCAKSCRSRFTAKRASLFALFMSLRSISVALLPSRTSDSVLPPPRRYSEETTFSVPIASC